MSLINIVNLTFQHDGSFEPVFENVSFQIDTDWKLGFIGRNGRGKTTFLKLLLKQYEYSGEIHSTTTFDYFPFEVKNKHRYTYEVINDVNSEYEEWKLFKEFNLLRISEDVMYREFNTLSQGEQNKVLLAALFLKDNNFLLIDEPTNHLDSEARLIVRDYLKAKKGFILVSHDRDFLDEIIDRVLSINKTDIEVQRGNFSSFMDNTEKTQNNEKLMNEQIKKDIKKLDEASRRSAGWADEVEQTKYGVRNSGLRPDRGFIGHKSAKMMKRAKATESRKNDAIQEKRDLLKNVESTEDLKIKPIAHHNNLLIAASNLTIAYDDKVIFSNINFEINHKDRVAIVGRNGSGKSSILKLIIGLKIPYNGTLQIASNLKISYVAQDTSYLRGSLDDYANEMKVDISLFKAILRKMDFSRLHFEKDISTFSEGQKKKVLIARSLCEEAHLYVWDEPLNYIDVFSRIQIEKLILDFSPTILFVEHDATFLDKIATKTILLK